MTKSASPTPQNTAVRSLTARLAGLTSGKSRANPLSKPPAAPSAAGTAPASEAEVAQVKDVLERHASKLDKLPEAQRTQLLDLAADALDLPRPQRGQSGMTPSVAQRVASMISPKTATTYRRAYEAMAAQPPPVLATFQTVMAAANLKPFEVPDKLLQATFAEKNNLTPSQVKEFDRLRAAAARNDPELSKYFGKRDLELAATLLAPGYAPIYMTKTLFGGGFGSVHIGLLPTPQGDIKVAIKELIIDPGAKTKRKNYVTSEKEALDELRNLKDLGAKTQALAALVVDNPKWGNRKLYIVMAYQQGELDDLFNSLPNDATKQAAAVKTLQSAAYTGTKLQKKQQMHGDIKPPNFLFDHKASIGISDMGLVAQLDGKGMRDVRGIGLACTPEWLPNDIHSEVFSGPKVDIWAVGATVWSVVQGKDDFGRGRNLIPSSGNLDRMTHAARETHRFNQWQAEVEGMAPKERLVALQTRTAKQQSATQHFDEGYLRFFQVVGEQVADVVTFRMMHRDPAKRSEWQELDRFCTSWLKKDANARNVQVLEQVVGEAAKRQNAHDRAIVVTLQAHKLAVTAS